MFVLHGWSVECVDFLEPVECLQINRGSSFSERQQRRKVFGVHARLHRIRASELLQTNALRGSRGKTHIQRNSLLKNIQNPYRFLSILSVLALSRDIQGEAR
jgi:hypothetical protein